MHKEHSAILNTGVPLLETLTKGLKNFFSMDKEYSVLVVKYNPEFPADSTEANIMAFIMCDADFIPELSKTKTRGDTATPSVSGLNNLISLYGMIIPIIRTVRM
ncbi:hypothetical protein AYI68_g4560 [Smittium mucronatum]|uniref:Uncharacterized protein n=1 Tax=Smittium mucronatum TaxID=133383 RepID=A0A1R0GWQ9_9FUNG|nr:hypothetical protein AYI68_g4560 [Smittium mucronatum]